MTKEVYR